MMAGEETPDASRSATGSFGAPATRVSLAEKMLAGLRYTDAEVPMTEDLGALLERLPTKVKTAKSASDTWFVYVARCADGTLYCGIARDVAARIANHDRGKGARYTRGRGPLALLAKRRCTSKGEALRLELAVKALPREAKEGLVSPHRFRAVARRIRRDVTP